MKTNRAFRVERMYVARKAWLTLRPLERPSGRGRTIKSELSFRSKRALAPGMKFTAWVQALKFEKDWLLKVRLALFDARATTVESFVHGSDRTGMELFDFDVLAAANFMDGKNIPWAPPTFALDADDDEIARHLTTYSRDIDRLWQFAGGYNVEGFRELAKWLLRNRNDVGFVSTDGIGPICTALEYGERDLAMRFLRELEDAWAERRRHEQHFDLVRDIYARVEGDHARLRALMDLPPKG